MKVLLLYGKKPSTNGLELLGAAKRLGHDAIQGSIMDISSQVSSSGSKFWLNGEDITKTDVCFLRSFGPGSCEQLTRRISMVEHLELSGVRVVNPGYPFRRARDKYATQYILHQAGLPVATTYTTENMERAFRCSQEMRECVYKPILGSMGKGSLKFDDPDLAYNAWKMLSRLGQPLIVQEYLHNPGRDVRIFVVGEEAIGTVYKYGVPGQWKTNVAQGGRMVEEQVSDEIVELGLKANNAMGLDYSGVDIIESNKGPVILEVNGAPGWQALKAATGIDVADRIIRYIME
jgi:RimK family alpha-L-glutamate ligase